MAGTTSGFADGRHEVSPDSEQMEQTATVLLLRNSGSVEQIQDRREEPSRLKTKKEPLSGLYLNGGKNASYIEPYILKLQQQLADKCSTKLIYMLNKWAARKAA